MGVRADRQKRYPNTLFGIPDLDLSEDLCAVPLAGPWFRGSCLGVGAVLNSGHWLAMSSALM
jgi:hypothetical protein